jgi:hypothetical protein
VLELFTAAAKGNPDALGAAAALVSIIAIIPAAIIFVINQVLHNAQLRQEKYRYLNDKYMSYLSLTLNYPEFDLEHGFGLEASDLDEETRCRLYVLFEIYTLLIEAAFRIYRNTFTSHKRTQWQGWVQYVDRYMQRADYRQFLSSIEFRSDLDDVLRRGAEEEV